MEAKPTSPQKPVQAKKEWDFETRLFALESEDVSDQKNMGVFKKIKAKFENCLYCRFNKGRGHIAFRATEDFTKLFSNGKAISEEKEAETKKADNQDKAEDTVKPSPDSPEPKAETLPAEESKDPKDEAAPAAKKLGEVSINLEKLIEGETEPSVIELKVNIMQMSEPDKEQFWRAHGKHLDSLLKRSMGQAIRYKPDGNACFSNRNVFLAGLKFKTLNEVRNFFKKLLKSKKPKDKVDGLDSKMLEELIKFHPKHAAKTKDFEGFVVDFHPDYPETKCFLVEASEGVTRDFSYVKCIKILADSLN